MIPVIPFSVYIYRVLVVPSNKISLILFDLENNCMLYSIINNYLQQRLLLLLGFVKKYVEMESDKMFLNYISEFTFSIFLKSFPACPPFTRDLTKSVG